MSGIANVTSEFINGDLYFYDKSKNEICHLDGTNRAFVDGSGNPITRTLRTRVTTAQVNAGLTLLAAIAGLKYRLIDVTLIAVGGAAATATAVVILATQAAGSATLVSAAVAALTQSAVVKPNSANVTVLADGASFIQNDVNTGVTIGKTGGTLATATAIDVILTYAIEP